MAKSSTPSFPKGMKVITGPGDTAIQAARSKSSPGASIKITNNPTKQIQLPKPGSADRDVRDAVSGDLDSK